MRLPRTLGATGLALMMLLPLGMAGAAAPQAAPMTVREWLALAADGRLPADCEAPLDAPTMEPVPGADVLNPTELLGSCLGIRPGGRQSNGCTFNFVFTDGASLYVGTAGHCTSSIGQRIAASGGTAFGSVVYRLNAGVGSDFALIKVDADRVGDVNPTMCVWGGPLGTNGGSGAGTVLEHYGWGFATSNTHARTRVQVVYSAGANSASWAGFGSGGDSGSPLITAVGKEAYAILTHGSLANQSPLTFGTTIQRALGLARAAGFNVSVVHGAPMADAEAPSLEEMLAAAA